MFSMVYDKLIKKALEARKFAYAPYSRSEVGAALLAKSGKIYTGCNIENASLGLGLCAERVALFKALSEGEREFRAIVVAAHEFFPPCGACLQVLHEFAPNIDVILVNKAGKQKAYKLNTLLPHPFR